MSIFKLLSLFYIPNISLYIIALRKNKKISIYKCYNKSSVQGGPCRSSFISNQIEGGGVGGRVTKLEPPNKYMPKFQCMPIYMNKYIQFFSSFTHIEKIYFLGDCGLWIDVWLRMPKSISQVFSNNNGRSIVLLGSATSPIKG